MKIFYLTLQFKYHLDQDDFYHHIEGILNSFFMIKEKLLPPANLSKLKPALFICDGEFSYGPANRVLAPSHLKARTNKFIGSEAGLGKNGHLLFINDILKDLKIWLTIFILIGRKFFFKSQRSYKVVQLQWYGQKKRNNKYFYILPHYINHFYTLKLH